MAVNGMGIKLSRFTLAGAIALTTAATGLLISAVQSQNVIKVDGSSTVFPITERVAEGFQKANSAKVTVGISGTGGGFKKFCKGETDISNASRPILEKEMKACAEAGVKYIELPVAYDALTVVVNPKNTWAESMTVAELKKIWEPAAQGKVTNWNQVRSGFPDKRMALFGPGADSGTFDYFTEAVNGKAKQSRSDFTGSEDDNVLVQGVSRNEGALGYFGLAYYEANKGRLRSVKIVNPKGQAVAPSVANVKNGSYQPLSRPIFVYVNAKSAEKPEVRAFVDYYMKNAPAAVGAVGYVPLAASDYNKALARFTNKQVGTVFAGKEEIGVQISDILSRTPQ